MAKKHHVEEPEEEEPQQGSVHTWTIIGVVLVIFLLFVILIRMNAKVETYQYNGFTFTQTPCGQEKCWTTGVVMSNGVRELTLYNGPRDVEDVYVSPSAVERIINMTKRKDSRVIIAFDPNVPGEVGVAATNIARITGERIYNITTTGAVYGAQVTCADANASQTVIYLTQATTTGATEKNGCILLVAPTTDELMRVADAFSLHILRIMQG